MDTTQSHVNETDYQRECELAFQRRLDTAFNKASRYAVKWLKRNKIHCFELFFEKENLSMKREFFKYNIKAIDQYHRRIYIFGMTCQRRNLEISFLRMSQDPALLKPGTFSIKIDDVLLN